MQCPRCKSDKVITVDSRPFEGLTRRRRECQVCRVRFTTLEVMELEYKNLKGKAALLDALKEKVAK
jgi:transcriptional regulator NrdR family protein